MTDEMTENATGPITIGESAVPAQTNSAIRAFLIALGGYMAGKGWIDSGLAAAAVPVLMIVGPAIWAQFSVRRSHAQRVALADAAPDSVAKVVRP